MVHAGVGKAKITPPIGMPMMGYAARDHGCEGIHDDLYVKAAVLDDGSGRIALLAADVAAFDRSAISRYKRRLHRTFGLDASEILINTSHTHSGPATAARTYLGASDPDYLSALEESLVSAVQDAYDARVSARLFYGLGESHIGVNRRLPAPDGSRLAPHPDGVTDPECPVLSITDEAGSPFAVLFSVACHATTMGAYNYLISADYPGAATRKIEERLGAALFFQGAGADVNPRIKTEEGRFGPRTFEDVDAVGAELAEDVLRVLSGDMEELSPHIRSLAANVDLPLDPPLDAEGFRRVLDDPEENRYRKRWAQDQLDRLAQEGHLPRTTPCTFHLVELSENLRIVALSGEVVTEIGRAIKERCGPGRTIVFGYSNGSVAYLPTARILQEGGYEATSYIYFGLPAPFSTDVERAILSGVEKMLEREI